LHAVIDIAIFSLVTKHSTTCSCGAHLSADASPSVECDEDGMRAAPGEATHALVSCSAVCHGIYRPTFTVAL